MPTPIIDRRPENPHPCCIICGKWVCHECWDFRRWGALRSEHQICLRCGGIEGQFTAIRHQGRKFPAHDPQPRWIAKPIESLWPHHRK